MRKLLVLLVLLLVAPLGRAEEPPPLRGYVNDYASMLSPETVSQLEQELEAFEKSDSTQIVVLTVPSLEGQVVEDYSIRVVEAWKIGQKGKDNGVLLLVVKNDRKVRIEAGRGVEDRLTDLVSGRIIRNEITPAFKQGDFDGGVTAGVHAIMATVRGEYAADQDLRQGKRGANPFFTFLIFVVVAAVFLGGISHLLGGIAGGIGLPVVASLSFSGLSFALLVLLSFGGFLMGLFLSFLFRGRGGFGGGWPFFGGFGGGGFGGGGFGGGGFSGGGGTFGGGGASGDW